MKKIKLNKSLKKELSAIGINLLNVIHCTYYVWDGTPTHIDRGMYVHWFELDNDYVKDFQYITEVK